MSSDEEMPVWIGPLCRIPEDLRSNRLSIQQAFERVPIDLSEPRFARIVRPSVPQRRHSLPGSDHLCPVGGIPTSGAPVRALPGDLLQPVPRWRRGSCRRCDQLGDARVRRRLLSACGSGAPAGEPPPGAGGHGLQIELSRGLYMDERSFDRKPYLDRLAADMRDVIAALAAIDPALLRPS